MWAMLCMDLQAVLMCFYGHLLMGTYINYVLRFLEKIGSFLIAHMILMRYNQKLCLRD